MELAAELEASLRDLGATPSVEVRENGGRVALFVGLVWEVRGAAQKPLLHLWPERHNFTRRVLAITAHSEQRLALAVERFGRARADRLEFVRLEFDPSPRDLSREESCAHLGRVLAEQFPDETLESLTSAPDLGIKLQPAPPLVYLVAPELRFHPTTDVLLRRLSPRWKSFASASPKAGAANHQELFFISHSHFPQEFCCSHARVESRMAALGYGKEAR